MSVVCSLFNQVSGRNLWSWGSGALTPDAPGRLPDNEFKRWRGDLGKLPCDEFEHGLRGQFP